MKTVFSFVATACAVAIASSVSFAFTGSSVASTSSSGTRSVAQEAIVPITNRIGDYAVTLRVPKAGVYAGEVIDIEFRVECSQGGRVGRGDNA